MPNLIETGGFLSLGGSSRRYLDLYTGREYSRREAERMIKSLDDAGRELRAMAAFQRRAGSIARDFIETRGKSVYDPLSNVELRDLREVYALFKSKDKKDIDKALKSVGRRRDDEVPIS